MGINSNGYSLPPHLPGLSLVLKGSNAQSSTSDARIYTVVSLSYRGYWTSRGRPSQKGVALDAAATIEWVSQRYPADSKLVLWGQSLGAGVATGAVAAQIENTPSHKSDAVMAPRGKKQRLKIDGLLLETPFTSIRDMLVAIYPQKQLLYRYLYPSLWNHWDSRQALLRVVRSSAKPQVLILPAGHDELVPESHRAELEEVCKDGEMDVQRVVIGGTLHHKILSRPKGWQAVIGFLRSIAEKS